MYPRCFMFLQVAAALTLASCNQQPNDPAQIQALEKRIQDLENRERELQVQTQQDKLNADRAALEAEKTQLEAEKAALANKHQRKSESSAPSLTYASNPPPRTAEPANHYVGYTDSESTDDVEDYDLFYDRLSTDGQWYYDDNYGYVFQPAAAVDTSDWRPYSDGHWVWTDRGWFWDSNEDFGWACYHYGRWVRISGTGWVWVPGSDWAPAWVSWRESDDHVGWAPLPPECEVSPSFRVSSWCDSYYDIGPTAYLFVRIGDWFRPSYRGYYAPPAQNVAFFNQTRNITNVYYNNTVINNYGPQVATLQQKTNQQIPKYNVNYVAQTQPNAAFKATPQGNQLQVVAPPGQLKKVASIEPPVKKQLGAAQVERGWQNVPQTQQAQLREHLAKAAPVPPGLPAKPTPPAKPQMIAAKPGQQPEKPGQPGKPGTTTNVPPGKPGQPNLPGQPPGKPAQPATAAEQKKPGTPGQNPELKPFEPGQKPGSAPPGPQQVEKPGQQPAKLNEPTNAAADRQKLEEQKTRAEQQKLDLQKQQQEKANIANQDAQRAKEAELAKQRAAQQQQQEKARIEAEKQHQGQPAAAQKVESQNARAEQQRRIEEEKKKKEQEHAPQAIHQQQIQQQARSAAAAHQEQARQARIAQERQNAAAAARYQAEHHARLAQAAPHPQAPPPHPQAAPHPQAPPPHPQAAPHPQAPPPHPQAAPHPQGGGQPSQGGKGKGNEKDKKKQ